MVDKSPAGSGRYHVWTGDRLERAWLLCWIREAA